MGVGGGEKFLPVPVRGEDLCVGGGKASFRVGKFGGSMDPFDRYICYVLSKVETI